MFRKPPQRVLGPLYEARPAQRPARPPVAKVLGLVDTRRVPLCFVVPVISVYPPSKRLSTEPSTFALDSRRVIR
jgi:hypothetical protein